MEPFLLGDCGECCVASVREHSRRSQRTSLCTMFVSRCGLFEAEILQQGECRTDLGGLKASCVLCSPKTCIVRTKAPLEMGAPQRTRWRTLRGFGAGQTIAMPTMDPTSPRKYAPAPGYTTEPRAAPADATSTVTAMRRPPTVASVATLAQGGVSSSCLASCGQLRFMQGAGTGAAMGAFP